jgi:hypothetical protein
MPSRVVLDVLGVTSHARVLGAICTSNHTCRCQQPSAGLDRELDYYTYSTKVWLDHLYLNTEDSF